MSSPLIVLLDGILSQAEVQVAHALYEIRQSAWSSCLLKTDTTTECVSNVSLFDSSYSPQILIQYPSALLRLLENLLAVAPELAGQANSRDGSLHLPLHFAASLGNISVASLFLDYFPAAASMANSKGKIPLHYAAREGKLPMVEFLLKRNPETAQIGSHKHKLALHFAAGDGHYSVCHLLLQVYPKAASLPSAKGKLPLHFAARWGYLDLCKLLQSVYQQGSRALDWDGSLPLHDAARQGQLNTAQYLASQFPGGVEIANLRCETPLFLALQSESKTVVDFLLQSWPLGARHELRSISRDDCVNQWSFETIERLLRVAVDHKCCDESKDHPSGTSINGPPSRFIALHAALSVGASMPIVNVVMEERPHEIHERDEFGRNALHWAVCYSQICNCIDMDIWRESAPKKQKKARILYDIEENIEDNPDEEVVRLVLSSEAAGTHDNEGKLPLHLALENNVSFLVLKWLLDVHPKSGILQLMCCFAGVSGYFKPFHLAAYNDCTLSVIYFLLRLDPSSFE